MGRFWTELAIAEGFYTPEGKPVLQSRDDTHRFVNFQRHAEFGEYMIYTEVTEGKRAYIERLRRMDTLEKLYISDKGVVRTADGLILPRSHIQSGTGIITIESYGTILYQDLWHGLVWSSWPELAPFYNRKEDSWFYRDTVWKKIPDQDIWINPQGTKLNSHTMMIVGYKTPKSEYENLFD